MTMSELAKLSRDRVATRFDEEFDLVPTNTVPSVDDTRLTFANKGFILESTVLYVDLRRSTSLSDEHQRQTTGKLYSAFIEEMIRCARHFNGHVRGIVGDRIMVVFDADQNDCFTNAVHTGILMNSIIRYVIKPYFGRRYGNEIRCGIGIDYGTMLVTKVGTISRSEDHGNYKDLVWLGRPANVASKLTDMANKDGFSAILMTEKVFDEYKARNRNSVADITENLWERVNVTVAERDVVCYMGGIIFEGIRDS